MKTALYDRHVELGAKMVDFAGWEMPIQYGSIVGEHKVVRESVGIFDVSHMGRIDVVGPGAEALLDFLSVNRVAGKSDGQVVYTPWANEMGGTVDDLLIYRLGSERFFVVANASNRDKDLAHIEKYASDFDVEVVPRFDCGIVAVQGPGVFGVVPEAKDLKPMRAIEVTGGVLSRTGYTGSPGIEFYGEVTGLWDRLVAAGVRPVGLGARDTLRLEMGYSLYGHELSDTIAPSESVSAWTVRLGKDNFVGKQALVALEENPSKRSQCGLLLQERGIARQGALVWWNGEKIGEVTSGTFSPTLERGIALAMCQRKLQKGEIVEIEVRGRRLTAVVTPPPFVEV